MSAIKFWARPAILVVLWVVLAALTAAELATVGPALSAAASLARAPSIRPVARARERHARRLDAREP